MTIRVLTLHVDGLPAAHLPYWERMGLAITRHEVIVQEPLSLPETRQPFDVVALRVAPYVGEKDDPCAPNLTVIWYAILGYARRIRHAPRTQTMVDGRRWCAVPIVIVASHKGFATLRTLAHRDELAVVADVELLEASASTNYGADVIRRRAIEYRFAMLSEFDHMGFLIRIERGRFMVGPAFAPTTELNGKYYFGPGDRLPKGFKTLHKDHFATSLEIEAFEALLNRSELREADLQRFFEEHPHFLSEAHRLRPNLKLRQSDGSLLIPDLILQPLFGAHDDSNWKLLELKLPAARLLVGKESRRRLSCDVLNAIAQVRQYHRRLSDSANVPRVQAQLGYPLQHPRLGVLIGRSRNGLPEAVCRLQETTPSVRVTTYDEILERQRIQLEFQRND